MRVVAKVTLRDMFGMEVVEETGARKSYCGISGEFGIVERLLRVALTVELKLARRGLCGASVFALRFLAFLDIAILE